MADTTYIGKITQAHGIKGLVKILPDIDDTSLFTGDVLDADGNTLTLTFKNKMGKYWLAEIKGVTDRNAAEDLCGTALYISKANLPDDSNLSLIGLDIVENNTVIGTLKSIENYGAGDLFDVTLKNGGTILIPDHENFIIEIGDAIIVKNHKDLIFD